MRVTKSQLKELIKQTIRELKFGSQAQYDAYARKHKIKPGTSVTVGDKKTTHKGKAKISIYWKVVSVQLLSIFSTINSIML